MNKGLEVIEAMRLFSLPPEKIDIVVHPQSIIHSLVEFEDRTYLAHLGETDMRVAIRYALGYPDRLPAGEECDLTRLKPLTFERPDPVLFPCLRLAYEAARAGGTMPAVLNAANEVAVTAFLGGRIGFSEIPVLVEETMGRVGREERATEETVFEADEAARREAAALLARWAPPMESGSR
jgi:1-deoxy-D-xylulose-5-phosphate reductoisomerase